MSKLTLILGGARSGKSDYGEQLAQELADDVLFIATSSQLLTPNSNLNGVLRA